MKQALSLAALSGSGLILNFLFQWIVVAILGSGVATDAFFAGSSVPILILSVTTASLTHVLVPLLAKVDRSDFNNVVWSLVWASGIITLIISTILALTSQWWTILMFPGFSIEGRELLCQLTRIQIFNSVLFVVSTIFWSAFNSRSQFITVEISGLAASVIAMGAFIATAQTGGVYAAAWCSLLRPLAQLILLAIIFGGFQLPNLRPELNQIWKKIRGLISASILTKSEPIIDRSISAFGIHGDLTHLHLATQAIAAGQMIFGRALVAPMVTRISNAAAEKNVPQYKQLIRQGVFKASCVGLVGLLGIGLLVLVLRSFEINLWRLIDSDFRALSVILVALSGFWVAGCLGQVMGPYFYCQGNTRTPALISIAGFIAGLFLKGLGFYLWGVVGVAIGTSFGAIVSIILYFVFAKISLRGVT